MRELGKWPRLVIVGDPVTPEQAEMILVRTQVADLNARDRGWLCRAEKVMGFPDSCVYANYGFNPDVEAYWRDEDDARERLGWLGLDILWSDRIATRDGQGWCGLDGAIGDSRWNVGSKWPEAEDIAREWQVIAEAFPFLRLNCQVVVDNGIEGYGQVGAQWNVADGLVRQVEIGPLLAILGEVEWPQENWEPGITLENLNRAVQRTVTSLNA